MLVKGGSHFLAASPDLQFVKTGCTLLDLVLGGGWPLGRIANIVGDKSTGKTLLAIEAAANFAREYPKGKIWYREAESAFDKPYAIALGMPKRVKFKKIWTVEDFFEDLEEKAGWLEDEKETGLYILDSLDALSDRKELSRAIDKNSYGGDKAKQMSELFRRLTGKVEAANLSVIVISQVRDAIGAMFGRKTKRSGGKALDFYASQVLYLSHLGTIYKTRRKQKRAIQVRIRAKCDKNKIGLPFRQCDFPIRFGFGIEDLQANTAFLKETGQLREAGFDKKVAKEILNSTDSLSDYEYNQALKASRRTVKSTWRDIETTFLPPRKKYKTP